MFQAFLMLLLLFYKQGGKQVMGRHSMGIGLGLFCWLYSRWAILNHSSSYTGQNSNRTHRGRIKVVVSIQKKTPKHSQCLCSCLNSSTGNSWFKNKANVTVKNANDTILTHSLTQYYNFHYLSIMKNKTSVKLQLL